jgi:hypothetical protein
LTFPSGTSFNLLQRILGIALTAAAEESPEGIAADAILAPGLEARSVLAALDLGVRGLALVDLTLRT